MKVKQASLHHFLEEKKKHQTNPTEATVNTDQLLCDGSSHAHVYSAINAVPFALHFIVLHHLE